MWFCGDNVDCIICCIVIIKCVLWFFENFDLVEIVECICCGCWMFVIDIIDVEGDGWIVVVIVGKIVDVVNEKVGVGFVSFCYIE